MQVSLYLGTVLAVLITTFILNKRYGLAGLGLCGGYLINEFFGNNINGFLQSFSVRGYTLNSEFIHLLILVIPMILMMIFSKKAGGIVMRIISTTVIGIFFVAVSSQIIASGTSDMLSFEKDALNFIINYRSAIISICVVACVIDAIVSQSISKFDKHARR